MVQNVKTISEETPVSDAAMIMLDNNFSGLPVAGDQGMTGIIQNGF